MAISFVDNYLMSELFIEVTGLISK